MNNSEESKLRQRVLSRTNDIRRAIGALDYVCPGSMIVRTKVCGRPNCRCAQDEAKRHGPYHEWTRSASAKLIHSVLSEDQAPILERALANHRELERLISLWKQISEEEILSIKRRK